MTYLPAKARYSIEISLEDDSSRRIYLQGNHVINNRILCENIFPPDDDGHVMVSLDNKLDTLFAISRS
jgi:hypothetical protein